MNTQYYINKLTKKYVTNCENKSCLMKSFIKLSEKQNKKHKYSKNQQKALKIVINNIRNKIYIQKGGGVDLKSFLPLIQSAVGHPELHKIISTKTGLSEDKIKEIAGHVGDNMDLQTIIQNTTDNKDIHKTISGKTGLQQDKVKEISGHLGSLVTSLFKK